MSRTRCFGSHDPLYAQYHDEEWGVPVHDDQHLFEMLILEGAQAGLSWETVLRKREGYRQAFHQFVIERVATMTDEELEKLRENPAIIRNKLKIYATRTNARVALSIIEEWGSLDAYMWSFVDNTPIQNHPSTLQDIPTTTGHIAVKEAGAIEATGHKILIVPTSDGKLTTAHIQSVVDAHTDEHMVKPKMVFISNSTEVGSIYTKQELTALSEYCQRKMLLLYLDGARLASALTAPKNDLTLADIASLVDVFYLGGTKTGFLFGEAIVLCRREIQQEFRWHLKQRGALLAKGRVLGAQFAEAFRDGLYMDMGAHANRMAMKIAAALQEKGYEFFTPPLSNQIFPILPKSTIAQLAKEFGFYIWKEVDEERCAIRLVTSWATPTEIVDAFIANL